MRLSCVQEAMKKHYLSRDAARGLHQTFTWLAEELGELAEAVTQGDPAKAAEEIADVIAWTLSLANLLGVDVEQALREKYPFLREACQDSPTSS